MQVNKARDRHRPQRTLTYTLAHSHTCMLILSHQENNLQFRGLTGFKGHILSLSATFISDTRRVVHHGGESCVSNEDLV